MIKKISLSNFKLHDDTEINMGGLTVLTGMNGMGKSSIIQALLLLRQSYFSNDLENGLNLRGDFCDLGISGELACQSSDKHDLKIDMDFSNQAPLSYSFLYPDNIMDTLLPASEKNVSCREKLADYSLFNENFQYISAFRFGPKKSYNRDTSLVVSKKQISKMMGQCEYTIHFLEQYKNQPIQTKELAILDESDITPDLRLGEQVGRWLREISPFIKIDVKQEGEDFKLNYKFDRQDNLITESMSAMNTGFGITYVLPILVAVLSAKKDALILIENPEAHIHPKGQAVLMKLIAMAVHVGIQVVIETHSDHIVNGSLVAVNQDLINKEELSLYFFDRDEHKHVAKAHQLHVEEDGHIHPAPPMNFFDQIEIDLRTLAGF
ncbi:MAG: DUF3696 domain-containing protein [Prevotella sp.]|nr:DUF3696 domain-containing protein [Prevotella sp.]